MEDIPSLITLFHAYFWNTVVQSKTTWVVLGGRPFVIYQLKTEGINPVTETHFQRKIKTVQAAVVLLTSSGFPSCMATCLVAIKTKYPIELIVWFLQTIVPVLNLPSLDGCSLLCNLSSLSRVLSPKLPITTSTNKTSLGYLLHH